jgi:hypothetical protein
MLPKIHIQMITLGVRTPVLYKAVKESYKVIKGAQIKDKDLQFEYAYLMR